LRGFLFVVTVFAVWLGWRVERAHKQREAVEVIEAIGGVVQYDWQGGIDSWETIPEAYLPSGYAPGQRLVPAGGSPNVPGWLRNLLGQHLFQEVNGVVFRTRQSVYSRDLRRGLVDTASLYPDKPQTAEIETVIPLLHNLRNLRVIYLQGTEKTISKAVEGKLRVTCPNCRVIREAMIVTAVESSRTRSAAMISN
jgi:hypothetical protein